MLLFLFILDYLFYFRTYIYRVVCNFVASTIPEGVINELFSTQRFATHAWNGFGSGADVDNASKDVVSGSLADWP